MLSLPHRLLCVIVRLSLSSLSRVRPPYLFILGTLPVVGLDVFFDAPAPELLWLGAEQASVRDPGVMLQPVDQVVDVVVADPRVVGQWELP